MLATSTRALGRPFFSRLSAVSTPSRNLVTEVMPLTVPAQASFAPIRIVT